jgi:hypothetical protein
MSETAKLSVKDKIAIVASVVALCLSLFGFFRDSVVNQHVLRASVVNVDRKNDRLVATILFVNAGKHYETLWKARFIYSDDLSKGGGAVSNESIGPIVFKPGEALVISLDAAMPNITALREDGTIRDPKSGLHVGVVFDAVTPSGELREDSKIFRFTEMFFDGDQSAGAKPRPGDHDRLIDLL